MFLLSEVGRHIGRNRARSALTAAAAALMVCCIALYAGNIAAGTALLTQISQAIPVTVQVMGQNGQRQVGLEIDDGHLQALLSAGVKSPLYTALAGGNLAEKNRGQPVKSCDTQIIGINSDEALALAVSGPAIYGEGWDGSIWADSRPLCIVSEDYAATHQITVGDILQFPLYISEYQRDGLRFEFVEAGMAELRVAGTYVGVSTLSGEHGNMVVPVQWLYGFVTGAGLEYSYSSFQGRVGDPLQLNAFKEQMRESRFKAVNPDSLEERRGDALQINDKLFVETADRIEENLALFRWFQLPFYLLVILLLTLIVFLLLRSARKDLAIASSLGRPKWLSGLRYFVETLLLMLLGCVAALPLTAAFGSLSPRAIAEIYLLFLACAGVGTALALALILRFDTLALLTKID